VASGQMFAVVGRHGDGLKDFWHERPLGSNSPAPAISSMSCSRIAFGEVNPPVEVSLTLHGRRTE
jgi:hypothetical protein